MAKVRRQAAEWATLIEQWRQSGLGLPAFCQRHGPSRGTMQNWVHKPSLKLPVEEARGQARPDSHPLPEPSLSFLPVRIAEAPPASEDAGIEVVLGPGRRVAVAPGFDAETLRRVVAVLEGRPC